MPPVANLNCVLFPVEVVRCDWLVRYDWRFDSTPLRLNGKGACRRRYSGQWTCQPPALDVTVALKSRQCWEGRFQCSIRIPRAFPPQILEHTVAIGSPRTPLQPAIEVLPRRAQKGSTRHLSDMRREGRLVGTFAHQVDEIELAFLPRCCPASQQPQSHQFEAPRRHALIVARKSLFKPALLSHWCRSRRSRNDSALSEGCRHQLQRRGLSPAAAFLARGKSAPLHDA